MLPSARELCSARTALILLARASYSASLCSTAFVLGAPVFARPALGPQGLTRLPMHSQRQRSLVGGRLGMGVG